MSADPTARKVMPRPTKMSRLFAIWLCCSVLLFAAGCRNKQNPSQSCVQPNGQWPATVSDIPFADPDLDSAAAALRRFVTASARGWRFEALAVEPRSPACSERWCTGKSRCPRYLRTPPSTRAGPSFQLSAGHSPHLGPKAGELDYIAGVPSKEGTSSLLLWLRLGTKNYYRTALTLTFVRSDKSFEFGSTYELRVAATLVAVHPPGTDSRNNPARRRALRAELQRLLASPASLRDTILERLRTLENTCQAKLDAHRIKKLGELDMSQYQDDGIPPPRKQVALTAAETKHHKAEVTRKIDEQRSFVKTKHAAIHALLLQVLPAKLW